MMTSAEASRRTLLLASFRMPSVQSMMSRKSSITNAFVSAIIPVIPPTYDEIDQALQILKMAPDNVRCAYCGDPSTEWDHLRPLVLNRRPTGYISEIANLVPACGKCNQSKGNRQWREWIASKAKLSPAGRGLSDVETKIERLSAYEKWRVPTLVDFEEIVGRDEWQKYWKLCDDVIAELRECQLVADDIRACVREKVQK